MCGSAPLHMYLGTVNSSGAKRQPVIRTTLLIRGEHRAARHSASNKSVRCRRADLSFACTPFQLRKEQRFAGRVPSRAMS